MSWEVSGTYMEACNCEEACPCVFFSPPTEGDCTVVLGWHIDQEKFDDTVLDDLNGAMLAHWPGHMKGGGPVHLSGHPLAISPGNPATVARSDTLQVSDHGLSCNVIGKNGLFAPYADNG